MRTPRKGYVENKRPRIDPGESNIQTQEEEPAKETSPGSDMDHQNDLKTKGEEFKERKFK